MTFPPRAMCSVCTGFALITQTCRTASAVAGYKKDINTKDFLPKIMDPSPMGSRRHIIRLGFSLSLLAWSFGAVLLGLGNAFIAPVEMAVIDRSPEAHTQQNLTTTTAQHTGSHHHSETHQSQDDQHSHHRAMATGEVLAADANPGSQTAHHTTTGALPAHCLFCLDGLSPSTLPQINLDTKPALSTADNPGLCKPSVGFRQVDMTPPLRSPPKHQFA